MDWGHIYGWTKWLSWDDYNEYGDNDVYVVEYDVISYDSGEVANCPSDSVRWFVY